MNKKLEQLLGDRLGVATFISQLPETDLDLTWSKEDRSADQKAVTASLSEVGHRLRAAQTMRKRGVKDPQLVREIISALEEVVVLRRRLAALKIAATIAEEEDALDEIARELAKRR